jgi:hypothetical protein
LELPPGNAVQIIPRRWIARRHPIARSVMPPGTAARVPIKQDRDARLPLSRSSSPRASPFQTVHSKSRLCCEPHATLNAERNIQIARDGRRDFKRRASAGGVLPAKRQTASIRAPDFSKFCGVGADGGATARPVLPRP